MQRVMIGFYRCFMFSVVLQANADQVNVGFNAGQVQATLPQLPPALCSKICQATEMTVLPAAAPCFE